MKSTNCKAHHYIMFSNLLLYPGKLVVALIFPYSLNILDSRYRPAPAAETASMLFPNACSEIFLTKPGWDMDMITFVAELLSA